MKYHSLFALLFFFAAIPASSVQACGNTETECTNELRKDTTPKPCCSKNDTEKQSANSNTCGNNSDAECPCDHQHGNCHCPGCGIFHLNIIFNIDPAIALKPDFFTATSQKKAFYFSDHLPEAVYLPIWQPPKLNA